ncbi:helix-turn-helix domain-containing protein [Ruminococcus sp. 5_1_39BFAA]
MEEFFRPNYNKNVEFWVLVKICVALNCTIDNIMEVIIEGK